MFVSLDVAEDDRWTLATEPLRSTALKKNIYIYISVCPVHLAANSRGLWLNWVRPRYECVCMNVRRPVVQEHAYSADTTDKSS